MVYTDKPLWTKIGKSIAYFGIFIFVYVSLGLLITKTEVLEFKNYDSKKHKITTSHNHFFGVIVDNYNFVKNRNKANLTVTTHPSYIGNFSRNAVINPGNISVITIGLYVFGFSFGAFILSISALYILKKKYYLFLILTFFNFWFIVVSMMMII